MDLFDQHLKKIEETQAPLAARMRPRTLDEFVGQDGVQPGYVQNGTRCKVM